MNSNHSIRNIFKKLVQIEYIVTEEKIESLLECLDNQYGNSLNEREKQSYVLIYCKNNCEYKHKCSPNYNCNRGFVDDNECLHPLTVEHTQIPYFGQIFYPRNGITLM